MHEPAINDNLQHVPECRSGRILSARVAIFDQGIRTFLISSALRCKATSFSVLTTGIVLGLETPAKAVQEQAKICRLCRPWSTPR